LGQGQIAPRGRPAAVSDTDAAAQAVTTAEAVHILARLAEHATSGGQAGKVDTEDSLLTVTEVVHNLAGLARVKAGKQHLSASAHPCLHHFRGSSRRSFNAV
jgi:hypothetical protein